MTTDQLAKDPTNLIITLTKAMLRFADLLEKLGERAFADALRTVCDLHVPTEDLTLRPGLRVTYINMPATVTKVDERYVCIDLGLGMHHRNRRVRKDSVTPIRSID